MNDNLQKLEIYPFNFKVKLKNSLKVIFWGNSNFSYCTGTFSLLQLLLRKTAWFPLLGFLTLLGISSTIQSIGSPMYCLEVTRSEATMRIMAVAL